MFPYNKKFLPIAKVLRKNMTPEEKHLWYDFLKFLPFPVKRQKNIGNYIVDFYIADKKTVIEIDGMQHLSLHNQKSDAERDADLASLGIRVLRYSNQDIHLHFDAIKEDILRQLDINPASLQYPE